MLFRAINWGIGDVCLSHDTDLFPRLYILQASIAVSPDNMVTFPGDNLSSIWVDVDAMLDPACWYPDVRSTCSNPPKVPSTNRELLNIPDFPKE
jgi:hypothetical protein